MRVFQKGQPTMGEMQQAYGYVYQPFIQSMIQPPPPAGTFGAYAAMYAPLMPAQGPASIQQGPAEPIPSTRQVIQAAMRGAHSRPIAVYGPSLGAALARGFGS